MAGNDFFKGGFQVSIEMEELEKALSELPVNIEKNILKKAVRRGLRVILDEAKRLVPVRTGNLKKSLAILPVKTPRGEVALRLGARRTGQYKGYHASLVEFGTVKKAAWPFMRTAVHSKSREAFEVTSKAISDFIEQELAKNKDQ